MATYFVIKKTVIEELKRKKGYVVAGLFRKGRGWQACLGEDGGDRPV